MPVLREIGREIRAQRANVRSRSKAQRQAAGLAGGAPPVLRKGGKENRDERDRHRDTKRAERRCVGEKAAQRDGETERWRERDKEREVV